MIRLFISALILTALTVSIPVLIVAQRADAPKEKPAAKSYKTYDKLFDSFEKRRKVLYTKMDRLRENERVDPKEAKLLLENLIALDTEYAVALKTYIAANLKAKDLMSARFERAATLLRIDTLLAEAVKAADEFLKYHDDSDLAADARFVRAQALFRMLGHEQESLQAMDDYLAKHKALREAASIRMMRVRLLLFLNKVTEAKKALSEIANTLAVKKDSNAKTFIDRQTKNLDWVGTELPEFTLSDTEGESLTKKSLLGKPALLFFWDSTSNACLSELSFVQQVQKEFGDKLTVIGISINESKPAFEQWLKRQKNPLGFKTAWIDRMTKGTLLKSFDVSFIPFSVLIDAEGKVYRYDVRSDDLLRYAPLMTKAK